VNPMIIDTAMCVHWVAAVVGIAGASMKLNMEKL
jgi:hypothetical protein